MGEEYHKTIPLFQEDIVNVYTLWNILKEKTKAELKGKIKKYWLEFLFYMNESCAINREKLVANLIEKIPEAKLMLQKMKNPD